MNLTKVELRNRIKKQLSLISQCDLLAKSDPIIKKTLNFIQKGNFFNIGVYFSVNDEVSTRSLISILLLSNKRVFLPAIRNESLVFGEVKGITNLKIGSFGIPEPKDKGFVYREVNLDLLILPCLAIDFNGNRLGRGKGYFDKFLIINRSCLAVCLAYDDQVFEAVETEIHDQPVDIIVTESRILRINHEHR